MEKDPRGIFSDWNSSSLINNRNKVRNVRLDNNSAWIEAQPLLSFLLRGYPQEFHEYIPTAREVFDFRRKSFLGLITDKEASQNVKDIVGGLNPDQQEAVVDLIVCIRDLFSSPPVLKGKKRLRSKPLRGNYP